MCDCNTIEEVRYYDGLISTMCRWAQELLDYYFSIIHCSARMMVDVAYFSAGLVQLLHSLYVLLHYSIPISITAFSIYP